MSTKWTPEEVARFMAESSRQKTGCRHEQVVSPNNNTCKHCFEAGRQAERAAVVEYLVQFMAWVNQGPECSDAVYEAKRHCDAIVAGEHLKEKQK